VIVEYLGYTFARVQLPERGNNMERKILCVKQLLNSRVLACDAYHCEPLGDGVLFEIQVVLGLSFERFDSGRQSAVFTRFRGKGEIVIHQNGQEIRTIDFDVTSDADGWVEGRVPAFRPFSFGSKTVTPVFEGRGVKLSGHHPTEQFVRAHAKELRKNPNTPAPRIPALYLPKFLVISVDESEEKKEAPP
jgi:hypothetical protein